MNTLRASPNKYPAVPTTMAHTSAPTAFEGNELSRANGTHADHKGCRLLSAASKRTLRPVSLTWTLHRPIGAPSERRMLERLFEEERRRTKAAPRPVLKLMFASLIRASERCRGFGITELERHQLQRLYNEVHEEAQKTHQPLVKPHSTPDQICSKDGT
jgi:hypothetical protein